MSARRVLITGLSTYWGGRLAQALERDPDVDVIVGVSPSDPTCELTRTEYVRVGTQHTLLKRIVEAAVGLLDENPSPSEDDIRHGLEGNLCRCTGYHNIVKAVAAVAGS